MSATSSASRSPPPAPAGRRSQSAPAATVEHGERPEAVEEDRPGLELRQARGLRSAAEPAGPRSPGRRAPPSQSPITAAAAHQPSATTSSARSSSRVAPGYRYGRQRAAAPPKSRTATRRKSRNLMPRRGSPTRRRSRPRPRPPRPHCSTIAGGPSPEATPTFTAAASVPSSTSASRASKASRSVASSPPKSATRGRLAVDQVAHRLTLVERDRRPDLQDLPPPVGRKPAASASCARPSSSRGGGVLVRARRASGRRRSGPCPRSRRAGGGARASSCSSDEARAHGSSFRRPGSRRASTRPGSSSSAPCDAA